MGVVTPYKSKNKKKVWTYCKYTLMRPFTAGWRRYGDEKAGHDPFGDFVGPIGTRASETAEQHF
jgi:hypothetical protein